MSLEDNCLCYYCGQAPADGDSTIYYSMCRPKGEISPANDFAMEVPACKACAQRNKLVLNSITYFSFFFVGVAFIGSYVACFITIYRSLVYLGSLLVGNSAFVAASFPTFLGILVVFGFLLIFPIIVVISIIAGAWVFVNLSWFISFFINMTDYYPPILEKKNDGWQQGESR